MKTAEKMTHHQIDVDRQKQNCKEKSFITVLYYNIHQQKTELSLYNFPFHYVNLKKSIKF